MIKRHPYPGCGRGRKRVARLAFTWVFSVAAVLHAMDYRDLSPGEFRPVAEEYKRITIAYFPAGDVGSPGLARRTALIVPAHFPDLSALRSEEAEVLRECEGIQRIRYRSGEERMEGYYLFVRGGSGEPVLLEERPRRGQSAFWAYGGQEDLRRLWSEDDALNILAAYCPEARGWRLE